MRDWVKRYWSFITGYLIAAALFFLKEFIGDPGIDPFSRGYVYFLCVVCIGLIIVCFAFLIHSWIRQRKAAKSFWSLLFRTLLSFLPAFISIIFGLGKIQVATYDLSIEHEQFQKLHLYCLEIREHLFIPALINILLIPPAAIMAFLKRKSGSRVAPSD